MASQYLSAATAEKMNPISWAIRPLKKYAAFSGRAPRAEYWWFTLANVIVGAGVAYADNLIGGPIIGDYGPISLLFTIGVLVPGLAVTVRRVHDINRSGWWVLLDLSSYIFLVPSFDRFSIQNIIKGMNVAAALVLVVGWLICAVVMFVFTVTRGTEGSNRYGPDPYGPDQLEEVFA